LLGIGRKKKWTIGEGCATEMIMSTQEDYHFLVGLLPHLRDIHVTKIEKLAIRLALQQVLVEEGSGESDRTEWSSDSSYYSTSTVPTPSSSYGCSIQKVNTHSTLLIPQLDHHKDIKNHHLHSSSLLNSYSLESKYVQNSIIVLFVGTE
jgi:hypothetical protein